MSIAVNEQRPGLHEVVLNGRLDTETAPELERRFADVLTKKVYAVRVDMAALSYISSMGVRVLFKAFKALRDKKAMFLMVHLQPQIKKVLDIAQALPQESVFSSIKEADEYYDAMQRKVLGQDVGRK